MLLEPTLTTLGNFLVRSNSQSSVALASFAVGGFQLECYAITHVRQAEASSAAVMAPAVSASCAVPVRWSAKQCPLGGVVGQQGCCYGGVSARGGVAVCRNAQRVVAVGQRSRERSHASAKGAP